VLIDLAQAVCLKLRAHRGFEQLRPPLSSKFFPEPDDHLVDRHAVCGDVASEQVVLQGAEALRLPRLPVAVLLGRTFSCDAGCFSELLL
jgi:hypothetical protein